MTFQRHQSNPPWLPTVPGKRRTVRTTARAVARTARAVLKNPWFVGIAAGIVAIVLAAIFLHIG